MDCARFEHVNHVIVAQIKLGGEHGGVADRSFLDVPLGAVVGRAVALVGHGHDRDAALVGQPAEPLAVDQGEREGLFDQYWQPALDAGRAVLGVQVVGAENHHAVERFFVEHFGVVAIPTCCPGGLDVSACPFVAAAEGHDFDRLPDGLQALYGGEVL